VEPVTEPMNEVEVEPVEGTIDEVVGTTNSSDVAELVDEEEEDVPKEVTPDIDTGPVEVDTTELHDEEVLIEVADVATTEQADVAKEHEIQTTELESMVETSSEEIEKEQSVTQEEAPAVTTQAEKIELPPGQRWAVSASHVDLSGKWKIIITDDFKNEYDGYLKNLGQPSLVRSVAVSIVEMTVEEVIQSEEGRALRIKGKNLRGVWDRTLIASGSDLELEHTEGDTHMLVPLVTADKEQVEAESWWEEDGRVHVSWLRGVKKYGGGDFESRRFLEDEGKKLVCESYFHPKNGRDAAVAIRWVFEKVG